ncbi:carbonic anhydrase/acetyltransferase-like protein (isoleucine patch superfamily) [Arthrobacter stackebrandtii]|uniref:Carbonic anhydrase/acetyltransferase-like protein (Isoleucine patch superfamily) n=1 Tax=Arthrobacter stackebrandtii TaxID=272161 RepID=A0ABS4YSC1_9MICC|nr:gamma carbonic anhydrase family protein [Arthrobacter stackebrandtii]MBP2411697.1 carbonic anhydrase/acetyltransferase-like protein (isoleucine patch superfamily) [Arthrobacter stackebrandtii]PYG99661.1 gamma carbonic anhydrase family protein [Arthrobacter stackebrandtii]
MKQLITFDGSTPTVHATAFLAHSAVIIGQAAIGAHSSAFYGVVVRGDTNSISVGEGSNLQDNVVLHADPGFPTRVGNGVSVGHGAVVHGCIVEDDCLIGMGATIMNGAVIGAGSLVAGGAVVLEGALIPPGSLVAGVPAKVRRTLTAEELEHVRENARNYVTLAGKHKALQGQPE